MNEVLRLLLVFVCVLVGGTALALMYLTFDIATVGLLIYACIAFMCVILASLVLLKGGNGDLPSFLYTILIVLCIALEYGFCYLPTGAPYVDGSNVQVVTQGGIHNPFLVRRISKLVPDNLLISTALPHADGCPSGNWETVVHSDVVVGVSVDEYISMQKEWLTDYRLVVQKITDVFKEAMRCDQGQILISVNLVDAALRPLGFNWKDGDELTKGRLVIEQIYK